MVQQWNWWDNQHKKKNPRSDLNRRSPRWWSSLFMVRPGEAKSSSYKATFGDFMFFISCPNLFCYTYYSPLHDYYNFVAILFDSKYFHQHFASYINFVTIHFCHYILIIWLYFNFNNFELCWNVQCIVGSSYEPPAHITSWKFNFLVKNTNSGLSILPVRACTPSEYTQNKPEPNSVVQCIEKYINIVKISAYRIKLRYQ